MPAGWQRYWEYWSQNFLSLRVKLWQEAGDGRKDQICLGRLVGFVFVCLFVFLFPPKGVLRFWKSHWRSDWTYKALRHLEWNQDRPAHSPFLLPSSKTLFNPRKFNSTLIPGVTSDGQKLLFSPSFPTIKCFF